MENSAEIRKLNKRKIYQYMMDGKAYTKQQVARGTGLSVATCNTLLNDLAAQGIVSDGQKHSGEVGRSSVLYQIRDDHEHDLAVHFYMLQGRRFVETLVFSATGKILSKETREFERIDHEVLEQVVSDIAAKDTQLKQIVVGTPSIAEHGVIRHCDIPELENVPLKRLLEQRFGLPVSIENDMHHKAYGYYQMAGDREEVITLGYFSSHILPGTATIHKGTIIRGANSFAGMTGFLPYEVSRDEQLKMLDINTCVPFVAKSIHAIIVLLNPSTIVLMGDLINDRMLDEVRQRCLIDVPEEYMPRFHIVDSFDAYYYEGMFRMALDRKEL